MNDQCAIAPASRPPEPAASLTDRGSGARTLTLTNSSAGAYLACPRRYWWAYRLGIRPEHAGARLSLGSAYHKGVEVLNRGGTMDAAVEAVAACDVRADLDRTIAACLVSGWSWRWSADDRIKRYVEVERVFEFAPSRRARCVVAGKIDAIAELADGRLAVVEYKTASESLEPGSDYWKRLLIDRQVSWYMLGARALGYPVTTIMYDAARVPGLRPRLLTRKKDAPNAGERESLLDYGQRLTDDIVARPDWYYARNEIPRLESDLEESKRDAERFARMIRGSVKDDVWPRNTDSCRRWGTCAYFGPCADSIDPTTQGVPNGYHVVPDVHAELTIMESDHDPGDNGSAATE